MRQRDDSAFHQQMEVIGHQDKGIASEVIALLVVAKPFKIDGIIGHVMKEGRPAVASGDHVIAGSSKFHPRFPCRAHSLVGLDK